MDALELQSINNPIFYLMARAYFNARPGSSFNYT